MRTSRTLGSRDMGELLPPAHLSRRSELARVIDHTILRATTTSADIDLLCDEALKYNFWAVCVNPVNVKQAVRRLAGSSTVVCSVVSFPLGASPPDTKLMEARRAITDGAREIDMVSNIGALKSGNTPAYFSDINEVAAFCGRSGIVLKVILECCYLTDEEKVRGARLAEQAGANFVKTSTGFGPGGATVADVSLLRKVLANRTGVKAAGGIGTLAKALEMVGAGASRIGTSSGAKILDELPV
ncbi:MAG TPA: deoxyribose-phosphate aldolase [Nitrososphaerales archaeon]|nr:deoxyribose-phosphate aldolase [Nitrososphaerales archaeon]